MMTRSWKVELWLDGYGNPEVCVSVDGRTLLPALTAVSAVDALEYIDEALIDFQRGDHIALIARRPPLMVAWTTQVRALALHWCADVLQGVWSQQVGLMRANRFGARTLRRGATTATNRLN